MKQATKTEKQQNALRFSHTSFVARCAKKKKKQEIIENKKKKHCAI